MSQFQLRKKAINKQRGKISSKVMAETVNAKYPKLRRLARSLLDENKAESEQAVDTNETKVGARGNKKVDTNSNNKT